jgi:hypothetical protein
VPIEVKRRRGTLRRDRLPANSPLHSIGPAPSTPRSTSEAVEAALKVAPWLGFTDTPTIALLREALEDYELARSAWVSAKDVREARAEVASLLSRLGFDPTTRARLGLAEVKAKSALENLLRDSEP